MAGTDLLKTQEVAELLRQPVPTLRYWRKQGVGPKSAKLGRHIFYRRRDVEAWVAAKFDQTG